jgi:hypothetical protein
MERMPTTKPSLSVVATVTFTPNSKGVRDLPLLMHSTSGACKAYSLSLRRLSSGVEGLG